MEKKVFGTRAIGLIAALAASSLAYAGGGATGGATEITQLLNKAELVAQVGESVQTTSNTLMSAQATMQQLRQLAPSTIAQMSGVPIDQVQKLANAYTVMSRSVGVYKDASDVLRKAADDSQRLGITPSELLRYKADAAYKHGGVYKQTYEQEQEKLARLGEVSKDVQQQAEQVKSIDANVKGIQFLAGQNVKMQASLVQLNDSIQTANVNAAMEAAAQQEKEGVHAGNLSKMKELSDKKEQEMRDGLSKLAPPGPTEVRMFK